MIDLKKKIKNLPQAPGVYFFRGKEGAILYIGKATNLQSRVSSYFRGSETRGHIEAMMPNVLDLDFKQTDSVLEALILESNLIKKHQPKYNVQLKDDKSFAYFVITKEEFPRVLIVRKTDLDGPMRNYEKNANLRNKKNQNNNSKLIRNSKFEIQNSKVFGPYTSKAQMQIALKIIRKIFPFHSLQQQSEKGCLDFQLGLCPGPYANAISKIEYKKNILGIRMILEGKKKGLIGKMEKEMKLASKKEEFEKAGELRNKIFALNHIRDIALLTRDEENFKFQISNFESNQNDKISKINSLEIQSKFKIQNSKLFRIEAYDISNISGQNAVGSMVVFENGKPSKSQYRKFKIKTVIGSDDVGMMQEVLLRRFKNDWPMPELVLLDGGAGHLNMAKKLLHEELGLAVNIAAVAKGPTRKKLDIRTAFTHDASNLEAQNDKLMIDNFLRDNLLMKSVMDEAHRFAVTFHRKLRAKNALE